MRIACEGVVYYGERGWRGGARSVAGDGEVEEPRWFGQFEGVRDPAGLRLPADSCIAGPTPAQAARCAVRDRGVQVSQRRLARAGPQSTSTSGGAPVRSMGARRLTRVGRFETLIP